MRLQHLSDGKPVSSKMNPLVQYMARRVLYILTILLSGALFNGAIPISLKTIPTKIPNPSHVALYNDTARIAVSAGWNMVSIPLVLLDGRVSVLFPHATSSAFAYQKGYHLQDTLEFGFGYWLKFPAAETIAVVGTSDFIPSTDVDPRWNMIGSSSVRTPVAGIVSDPNGLIASKVYGYNATQGYTIVDTLEPGKGYWVKCDTPGTVLLTSTGLEGPSLLSPANQSVDQPTTIVLRWTAVPARTSYYLQVGTDSFFTQSMLVNDSLGADTSRKLCLGYGTTCYWRVSGRYKGGLSSPWSPVWRFTTAVPAESLRWEFLGFPYQDLSTSPDVRVNIAIHPENDSIMYLGVGSDFSAGTQGKIFKTTNLGATWDTLAKGVTPTCIRINPQNPDIVYVGLMWANYTPPGIIKTTDGGVTWEWSNNGIYVDWETYVGFIEFDPRYPDIMYACRYSCCGSGGPPYKTIDAGAHWFSLDTNHVLGTVGQIAVRPDTTSIIFGVANNVLRSSDGGSTWTWTEAANVWGIAIDPVDPQIMYGITDGNGGLLKKSTDGGWTWFTSNQGLHAQGVALLIRNCTREVFDATYESSDLGETWNAISSLPNSGHITAETVSTDGSYLYMALYNFGIYRTRLISGKPN